MTNPTRATEPGRADMAATWHALSGAETLAQLKSDPQNGLSADDVAQRQAQYGLNQLMEKPRPGFLKLVINQLNSFVVILLIVASLVSAALGDWTEAVVIMAIVVLNAILGVVQESRAEEALAALKRMAAPEAQVLRDGRRGSVPARELVPGDVVYIEAGNFIPADIRLLESANLRVEEAALTGESLPVEKNATQVLEKDIPLGDRKNTIFMGTMANYGRASGVVVCTGMQTQLGLIAGMLQEVEEGETPLQKRLNQLGKLLGVGTLVVCAVVFAVSLMRLDWSQDSTILMKEVSDVFMIAVSLAIAAVPEGLAAVVTISLALGMREMVKRHALIRRLASVETLGSATVICSDKTGTLTQNEMTVTRLWADNKIFEITGSGYHPRGEFLLDGDAVDMNEYSPATTTLWLGALNNDAHLEWNQGEDDDDLRMVGDPTEGAILVAAVKAGADLGKMKQNYPRREEIPFDSTTKRMVTIHQVISPEEDDISPFTDTPEHTMYVIAVKGAPDVVLDLCTQIHTAHGNRPMDEISRRAVLAANDTMTHSALRVLGMAYCYASDLPAEINSQSVEQNLIFSGLIGMIDPPRMEAAPALEKARLAGIRTVMITGDYPNTARAIAERIGLLQAGHQVISGPQLNQMDEAELRKQVMVTDVFARVSPEHKMRIVDALRANDQVVAMTGDGVNDAPAIKRADIGVAMGITGTDVAKETADMVLTDDNYASIVAAIEQGRIIYSNIRKFVYYLLSCNLAEIATIFIATLLGWGSPLTAIQLLWLNLLTDGAPALALATEKGDPDIMQHAPRPPKESIINHYMRIGMLVQTVAITFSTLFAFYLGKFSDPQHVEFAGTMAFVTLSCSELLRAFTARSEYYLAVKIGILGNRWMNYAVMSSLVMIMAVVYVPFLQTLFNTQPLGLIQWLEILPLLVIPSAAAEITKVLFAPRKAI